MIAVLKPETNERQLEQLCTWIRGQGVTATVTKGAYQTVLVLVGDTTQIDAELLESMDAVESVKRITEPVKSVNRKFHPDDTVVELADGLKLGGGNFQMIAGPCSVESREQIIRVAQQVQRSGATLLRGGAFKPRTSPYDFQGLRGEGLRLLLEAKKETHMPVVTELMSADDLPLFADVDVIQVGARNMQNFDLLKHLGALRKPVLLKRGLANTINELLLSAEYIIAGGNENIILCERGIRTFETYTRNTLDLSAVPLLHELTHLPVVVDPSHATGMARLVEPMALAAAACGADGIMIEVHNDPPHALSDGAQSLTPAQFDALAQRVFRVRKAALGEKE